MGSARLIADCEQAIKKDREQTEEKLGTHNTGQKNKKETREEKINNVYQHFQARYGTNNSRLQGWQQLCIDLKAEIGSSITQCKKVFHVRET
jgi:hypothetical protein